MTDLTHCEMCKRPLRRRPPTAGAPLRLCPGCKKEKKLASDAAYRDSGQKKDLDLQAKYGITLAEYMALLTSQDGHCALCPRRPTARKALAVDHDHKTGSVRGLLCTYCNRQRLGRGREDPMMHRKIVDYLENGPSRVEGLLGRDHVGIR